MPGPCTRSNPSGLGLPACRLPRLPGPSYLSVCRPARLCDSAAVPARLCLPSSQICGFLCGPGRQWVSQPVQWGASLEPSLGQEATPGVENAFLCREALRALPSQGQRARDRQALERGLGLEATELAQGSGTG